MLSPNLQIYLLEIYIVCSISSWFFNISFYNHLLYLQFHFQVYWFHCSSVPIPTLWADNSNPSFQTMLHKPWNYWHGFHNLTEHWPHKTINRNILRNSNCDVKYWRPSLLPFLAVGLGFGSFGSNLVFFCSCVYCWLVIHLIWLWTIV